ncbi:MAG: endonuclease/exonuclease/phosphatase family protein [Candidatus Nanopelagicales bacterium]
MRRLILGVASVLAVSVVAAAPGLATTPASPSPVSAAGKSAGAGPDIEFATWNFCNHTCPNYERRLDGLVRTIRVTRPDVLALQEVKVGGEDHLVDVEERLGVLGYANTNPSADETCSSGCESHIFIRTAAFTVLGWDQVPQETERCRGLLDEYEYQRLRDELQRQRWALESQRPDWRDADAWNRYQMQLQDIDAQMNALDDEWDQCWRTREDLASFASPYFGFVDMEQLPRPARGNPAAFAFVRHRASGAKMLALSMHLLTQNGTGANGPDDRARNAAVRGLAQWTKKRANQVGLSGIPTIMMGDFNSYLRKQPRGPQWVLQREGFVLADKARVGRNYATVNKTPVDARWDGFPPRPRIFPDLGPQIDTIMTRGAGPAKRFEVFVKTLPNGRFDERFRASDHNLVRATIQIPR